jgi:hypothetical protein
VVYTNESAGPLDADRRVVSGAAHLVERLALPTPRPRAHLTEAFGKPTDLEHAEWQTRDMCQLQGPSTLGQLVVELDEHRDARRVQEP